MIQATSFPTIQVPTIDVFFLSAQHQVFRFHISYNRWHDLEKFHITCTFDNRNKSHNLHVHNAKYPRQKARYRIIKVVRNEMSKQHCFLVNMKCIKSLTTWITYSISFCHTEIIIFKQFLFLSVLLVYVVNANKLTFPFQIIKNKNMHCQFIFIRFFSSSVLSFILTQIEYKWSFHYIHDV